MVRAVLTGTKTQTRRVVKWRDTAPGLNLRFSGLEATCYLPGLATLECRRGDGAWERRSEPTRCPFGRPGDRLWVREAWAVHPDHRGQRAIYRADRGVEDDVDRWVPSIHMPRWASRISLEVTAVRVERLRDITEADAMAEGCSLECMTPTGDDSGSAIHGPGGFHSLWESINGPGSWDANPWLWVVEFRRIEP